MTKEEKQEKQGTLFELGPSTPVDPAVRPARYPVWTENKAKLIQLYLRFFVYITHHGVYIDAFAGPQEPEKLETWAAKLVLESQPRWLRKFFLFELDADKVQLLEELKAQQPPQQGTEPKRSVDVFSGDVNERIATILDGNFIRQKEATFCLLDQRTFECDWATVQRLAAYKEHGQNKIELFYFLPNAWLDRAFAGLKSPDRIRQWWGRDDWEELQKLKGVNRAQMFVERFKKDLGYASAKPWPIYEREDGGKVMYFMIHATDHPEAPKLMDRAYHKAVVTEEEFEQMILDLDIKATSSGEQSSPA